MGKLMKALQRIYCTSSYFKEERMATLLRKVLKVVVMQADDHLVPLYEVAKPRKGFATAIRMSIQLHESFKAFIDYYPISEAAGGAGEMRADRRPATALGSKAD